MKRVSFVVLLCCCLIAPIVGDLHAQQPSWVVGMRVGLSVLAGGGGGNAQVYNYYTGQLENVGGGSGAKAGFQFGPTGEVVFDKQFAVVQTFNINTQSGTPIEWQSLFKYYFDIPKSQIKPYADAGFSLFFVTGGPYVGIPFGGGVLFPITKNFYIPADVQFGPIFATGSTVFGVEITTGVRFWL